MTRFKKEVGNVSVELKPCNTLGRHKCDVIMCHIAPRLYPKNPCLVGMFGIDLYPKLIEHLLDRDLGTTLKTV